MTITAPAGGKQSRSKRAWLLASLLVPLVMFVTAAWYDRTIILHNAHQRLESTIGALTAQAEAVMETADIALSLQLAAIQNMDWPAITGSEATHQFLTDLNDKLSPIESAFFVDPDGFNSASSRLYPMPRYDLRDREYYQRARQGETGVVVSAPFQGRFFGDSAFTISRARLTDGRFDGIAAVTLTPKFFRDLYRDVLPWPEGSAVLLVRADGVVLASYPAALEQIHKLPAESATMRAAATRTTTLYEPNSINDGRSKLAAIRWLPGRDLFVVGAFDRGRLMATWYMHLGAFAAFSLVAAMALAATTAQALRHAAYERNSLQALVAETKRRQEAEMALQQAQKMDALGRLTGGVAHDFNNLLTAVLGSLELAVRRVSDPVVLRLLKGATTAAERGAKLTAQMLAFARKQSLQPQALDANEVVQGMDELLRRSIGPLVGIRYDLAPSVWPVLADRVQLELAILNLVANAHDAMPDGGEVVIATANVPDTRCVRLSIADTGTGMSPEVRASAFEPFFTTKAPGKGTGLGLSMVYGFATQAGGSVSIDSSPGEGTTVAIDLPRAVHAAECGAASDSIVDTASLRGLLVLLVDDDTAAREPTAAMLRELGCVVTDVSNGAAALELLRTPARYDVLLADFAMPEMNGAQLATAVKALRPTLPIVFLTGYAEETLLERLHPLGAQVVGKPFRLETLSAALTKATRNAADELAAED